MDIHKHGYPQTTMPHFLFFLFLLGGGEPKGLRMHRPKFLVFLGFFCGGCRSFHCRQDCPGRWFSGFFSELLTKKRGFPYGKPGLANAATQEHGYSWYMKGKGKGKEGEGNHPNVQARGPCRSHPRCGAQMLGLGIQHVDSLCRGGGGKKRSAFGPKAGNPEKGDTEN